MLNGITIDGIDLVKGQERYPGKAFGDVIRAWCIHTPPLLDRLRTCIDSATDKDLSDYIIAVHGLKGSSFGIYADSIGKQAEALEAAARRQDIPFVTANTGPLVEETVLLLENLKKLLESMAGDKSTAPLSPSPDPVLLNKLLEASKGYKSSVMEEALSSLEAFRYESGGDLIAWLHEQMDNLEYDAIREKLEDYLQK